MDEKKSIRFRLTLQIALLCVAAALASMLVEELNDEGFLRWLWRDFLWGLQTGNVGRSIEVLQWFKPELTRLGIALLFALAALFALVRTVKLAWQLTKLEGNPYLDSSREKAVVSPREGQDRYIKQLDEYLKNGIIDKAEYKILRERYGRR